MLYPIDSDEFYPVYQIIEETSRAIDGRVELTPEERADFERVWKEWNDWQERIGGLL